MTAWEVLDGPQHELAEEPVWDTPRSRLLWVDVARGEAWSARFDGAGFGAAERLFAEDGPISAVRVAADGTMTYAVDVDVVQRDPFGRRKLVRRIDVDPSRWRVNGLVILPAGQVLAGTLSRDRSALGGLWVVDRHRCTEIVRGVRAANGLAVDAGAAAVWHVDSSARTLTCYPVVNGRATASRARVLAPFGDVPGKPDGICLDSYGALWVAMWDGGCVVQLDHAGTEVRRLEVPVRRPTCPVAFADLLVVTTARSEVEGELEGRVLVSTQSRCGPQRT